MGKSGEERGMKVGGSRRRVRQSEESTEEWGLEDRRGNREGERDMKERVEDGGMGEE